MKNTALLLSLFIIIFSITSCQRVSNNKFTTDENNHEEENINKDDDKNSFYKNLELKDTKEISVLIEDAEEKQVFKLLDNKNLPYITYVPENCNISFEDNKTIITWEKLAFIEILMLDDSIGEDEAFEQIKNIIDKYSQVEKIEDKSSTWKTVYNMIDMPKDGGTLKCGYVWLGEHNNKLFIIYWHLDDMAFADIVTSQLIATFQEWIWKDTEENIGNPFD